MFYSFGSIPNVVLTSILTWIAFHFPPFLGM